MGSDRHNEGTAAGTAAARAVEKVASGRLETKSFQSLKHCAFSTTRICDTDVRCESHLREQCIDGGATGGSADAIAAATHSVDLIDENDGPLLLTGCGEQLAHTSSANTDIHFVEFTSAGREERHSGLSGHGLGQQSLA
jgi:hypothetical protein